MPDDEPIHVQRNDDRDQWEIATLAGWQATPWKSRTPWEVIWRYYRDQGKKTVWVNRE